MNIIVLGNGFDLAHGLPTRYTDFLKYCHDYNDENMSICDDQDIANEFNKCIKDNIWLSYFLKITPNLDEEKTWIDFEIEILKVIQGICPGEWIGTREEFDVSQNLKTLTREEFKEGQYGIFSNYVLFVDENIEATTAIGYVPYHTTISVDDLYSKLREFTRAFEIYCCQIINEKCGIRKRYKLNDALLSPTIEDSKQETYIVSFNYTRTFNRYYDYVGRESLSHYTYVYPHGEACTDVTFESTYGGLITSGLVLGTRSFDREADDNEYKIPVEFNVFQKHNQQHRYSTLADFQHLLMELRESSKSKEPEPVNIFVIGHSLDISDHTKLKHLFTENKNARITAFYHDETSFQRYINNITDILGESDVAVRVRFYHQNNQTNGLLIPYWSFKDGRVSSDIIDRTEEQVSDILTDHFLSSEIPPSLDDISTHTTIESVTAESIDSIELKAESVDSIKSEQKIEIKGSGYIKLKLQIGKREDGNVSDMVFPLEFTLSLIVENSTGKPDDEKYVFDDINYKIDTSSWYEDESNNFFQFVVTATRNTGTSPQH